MDEQTAMGEPAEETPVPTEASSSAPRKSAWKPVVWVAVGITLCAVAFLGYSYLQQARATEREQAFQRALEHFEDAAAELERAQSSVKSVKTGPPTTKALKAISRKVTSAVENANTSLVSAKKAAGIIEDEKTREQMQEAIKNAETASEQYGKSVERLPESAPLLKLANEVPDNSDAALTALNDTIELINDEHWSDADKKQKYGMSQAQTGIKKIAQMERLREKLGMPGGGVSFAREDLELSKQGLGVEAQLIKMGRSHSSSAFNVQVKKYNTIMKKGRDLAVPEFYDDPKVFLEAHFTWVAQGDASLSFAKSESAKAKESFLSSQKD